MLQKLKEQSEKELEDMQIRIACLADKIQHCQEVIDSDGIDDCNLLNW